MLSVKATQGRCHTWHRSEQCTVPPRAFSCCCGSVCFHDFPIFPGSTVDYSPGVYVYVCVRVCVHSWQWQLEWYGLYTALTCIIGHTECSVQCQRRCCHSDKAVASCWRLTDLALHQQAWTSTLRGNYAQVLATYKCLYSTHAWVYSMFNTYLSNRAAAVACFGLWLLNGYCLFYKSLKFWDKSWSGVLSASIY